MLTLSLCSIPSIFPKDIDERPLIKEICFNGLTGKSVHLCHGGLYDISEGETECTLAR